jgi:sigma-B regulation protein RsbU (phosphoserine phosphatase)
MLADLGDPQLLSNMVLDSINEGVYVTDIDRTIRYWGKAAERITGWTANEVVGKKCLDDILCHIDKDGHRLCGEEYCPLHRSIITGKSSTVPIIVFAQTREGGRVPLQVSVSPLRNEAGETIGGVETFRDISYEMSDIDRARKIQQLSLQHELPFDPRVKFTFRYVPQDVIGGDYLAVGPLTADHYGFLIADVTGHGVPAALYTMFLSSLWATHRELLIKPAEFASVVGNRLEQLIEESMPFAAAICGVLDLKQGVMRLVGAGNPTPLIRRANGTWEEPQACGLPLGLMCGAEYEETVVPLQAGDSLLFFTDGAVEIRKADGEFIGTDGLRRILDELHYPMPEFPHKEIESRLLTASNRIRFDDDLTFLDVQIREIRS